MRLLPYVIVVLLLAVACSNLEGSPPTLAQLEADNPVRPLPPAPLGFDFAVGDLKVKPSPERVRLGRWLFFDPLLSGDGSISCATCHRPENGFSEPTPTSTGIRGQVGGRKAPSFVNAAYAFYPATFWDGRAASLEEQAKGPIENPIEMDTTHEAVVASVSAIENYRHYFADAFGDDEVTIDRIAHAIADYERTRVSGNSRYDQWIDGDEDEPGYVSPLTSQEILGEELFFGKGLCATCHVGTAFTDSLFHNLGIGYDEAAGAMQDVGRSAISGDDADTGAFKTPALREVTKHAPYMHDGSLATLRDVMDHYNKGGTPNPWLSPKMQALNLTDEELDALVAFMHALDGEGWQDTAPAHLPR
jgi:cytochrome c peroxidase